MSKRTMETMERRKNKKLYIIVAAIFLVVALATVAVILCFSPQDELSHALSLGDRYLSDMDYESALREYARVLSIDPANEEALSGMMLSYAGLGENEKAKQIFENQLSDTKRTDVLEAYGKLLEEDGAYSASVGVVKKLIEIRDADEDYERLEELLGKILSSRRHYSEGPVATIEIRDGQVNTMGSNRLGTLGTTTDLGKETVTETMASADFTGTAVSVYTFGTNCVVIDENGDIWIAGSNRSGQNADGSAQMIASSGWTQITPPSGKTARIAGFDSTVFALTNDGTLWVVGQNAGYVLGPEWLKEWTPVAGFGKVLDLQYTDRAAAFLNDEGEVFLVYANRNTSDTYAGTLWELVADKVACFALYGDNIVYCTSAGEIACTDWNIDFPREWNETDSWGVSTVVRTPFAVRSLARVQNGVYLLSPNGQLRFLQNGVIREFSVSGSIEEIYTSGQSCVVELQDGGYLLYDRDGNQK